MSVTDITRIIKVKDSIFTENLMAVGAAALIGYDYLLTARRESRLFWRRRVNTASILFFTNRYLALVYYVGLAYYRCLSLLYPAQYYLDTGLRYLQYFPWAVFSALRVYALSQRSRFLSAFVFIWAVLAFPLDYYGDFHHTSFVNDPMLGCTSGATTPSFLSLLGPYFPRASQSLVLILLLPHVLGTIFIRGGQIIADAVVIGVTWKATYHARSEGSMSFLTRVMFRNGTMYFAILLVLNSLHTVSILPTSFLHIPYTNTAYVTKFSEPITAILISHFILDLHETNRAMSHQDDLSGIQIIGTDMGRLGSEGLVSEDEEVEEWTVTSNPWRETQSA